MNSEKKGTDEETAKELVAVLPEDGRGYRQGMYHDILHVLSQKSSEIENLSKGLAHYVEENKELRKEVEILCKELDPLQKLDEALFPNDEIRKLKSENSSLKE